MKVIDFGLVLRIGNEQNSNEPIYEEFFLLAVFEKSDLQIAAAAECGLEDFRFFTLKTFNAPERRHLIFIVVGNWSPNFIGQIFKAEWI